MEHGPRKFNSITIFFLFLVGIAFSASIAGAFSFGGSSLERISNKAGVKISAQYLPQQSSQADETSFRLNLSTHYVDLGKYDIQNISFVRIDEGPLQPATKWLASGSGHHIQGILSFAEHLLQDSRQVQLIVKGVGDTSDRIFEWKAPFDK